MLVLVRDVVNSLSLRFMRVIAPASSRSLLPYAATNASTRAIREEERI